MSLRHHSASMLPVWLCLALWGCGNDDARAGGALQDRDASVDVAPTWALAAEPRFSLIESPGNPPIYFVSPLEGLILEDGSAVIRDGSTTVIYVNPDGTAPRIAAGPGGGPGEFRRLSALLLAPGGSGVWAWDRESRRLSRFDQSGEYVTSIVPLESTRDPPLGILPGPVFVTIVEPSDEPVAEARRLYALRDSQWTVVREIGGPPEPLTPWLAYEVSGITGNTRLPDGCDPRLVEVVVGNELMAADAASGVIHAFGADGSVREAYRAARRQRITPEILAALESSLERRFTIPGMEAPANVRREFLEDVRNRLSEMGDRLPAWQGVLGDPEGRIWLERPECPLAGGSEDVFDVISTADGQHLGSITIAAGMTVLAVRGDHVLVRRLGELDLPHVEMYRLIALEAAASAREFARGIR